MYVYDTYSYIHMCIHHYSSGEYVPEVWGIHSPLGRRLLFCFMFVCCVALGEAKLHERVSDVPGSGKPRFAARLIRPRFVSVLLLCCQGPQLKLDILTRLLVWASKQLIISI